MQLIGAIALFFHRFGCVKIKHKRIDIKAQVLVNLHFKPRRLGAGRGKRVHDAIYHNGVVRTQNESDFFQSLDRHRSTCDQGVNTILKVKQVVNTGIGLEQNPLSGVIGSFDPDFTNVHIDLLEIAGTIGESDAEGGLVGVFFAGHDQERNYKGRKEKTGN